MKYRVVLSRQAERFYTGLQKSVKSRVREALLSLEGQPYTGKHLHGELKDNYSLRVGKIRVVYTVSEEDKTVYVVAVGLRKTVYR